LRSSRFSEIADASKRYKKFLEKQNKYYENIKMLYLILAILIGVFLVIYGGYDDSPGAQLLGLVIVVASIVGIIKRRKKTSS